MLKIVPDPPHNHHSLEDTLIQAADYALCAQSVANQAILLQPKSPVSILMMATMHKAAPTQTRAWRRGRYGEWACTAKRPGCKTSKRGNNDHGHYKNPNHGRQDQVLPR